MKDEFNFTGPGHVVGQGCIQTVIFDHKDFNLMLNHAVMDEHTEVRKYKQIKVHLTIEYEGSIYSVDSDLL